MSLNPIIERYKDAELLIVTRASGSYVNGRWIAGEPEEFAIEAAVLPLAMSDMATDVAASGLETRDSLVIYTEFELLESDEGSNIDRDTITWRDREYIIKMVVPRYQIPRLAHYKAIAVLKDS